MGRRKNFLKIYRQLGTRAQNGSLVLFWTLSTVSTVRMTSMAHIKLSEIWPEFIVLLTGLNITKFDRVMKPDFENRSTDFQNKKRGNSESSLLSACP